MLAEEEEDDDGGGGLLRSGFFFYCLTRFERVMVGMHGAPWLCDKAIKVFFLM